MWLPPVVVCGRNCKCPLSRRLMTGRSPQKRSLDNARPHQFVAALLKGLSVHYEESNSSSAFIGDTNCRTEAQAERHTQTRLNTLLQDYRHNCTMFPALRFLRCEFQEAPWFTHHVKFLLARPLHTEWRKSQLQERDMKLSKAAC